MKKLFYFSIPVFIFLLYGIYLSLYQFRVVLPELQIPTGSPYYDYRGITNVHSSASTGSGNYTEILNYARNSKLDFIIFTEVNLPARPMFIEGYFQDTLVLTGGMYSYFDSRLLYYGGMSDTPPVGQSQTQVFFADLLSQKYRNDDSIVVLAHPFYSRFSWKGDYPPGLNGVEVINLKSVLDKTWKESKVRTLYSLLLYPFNPSLAFINIFSSPLDELALWDQLNRKNHVTGFAGNDTNARIPLSDNKFIKFPSYETSFNLISNHILIKAELTGDFKSDKRKVLSALLHGQFYFSLDLLGNPKGFFAEITDGSKKYSLGSEIKFRKGQKLIIELPQNIYSSFQVHVIKDGEEFFSSNSVKTVMNINTPGIYRIEVKVNPKLPMLSQSRWLPWIYTNNFYVRD